MPVLVFMSVVSEGCGLVWAVNVAESNLAPQGPPFLSHAEACPHFSKANLCVGATLAALAARRETLAKRQLGVKWNIVHREFPSPWFLFGESAARR